MKLELILILAMCAFAAAMVPMPREKREAKQICLSSTPCAWAMYKPHFRIIEHNVINTYCKCGNGTVCVPNEDDQTTNAYIHRCRPPSDPVPDFDS